MSIHGHEQPFPQIPDSDILDQPRFIDSSRHEADAIALANLIATQTRGHIEPVEHAENVSSLPNLDHRAAIWFANRGKSVDPQPPVH
jgi:hypothetical protein